MIFPEVQGNPGNHVLVVAVSFMKTQYVTGGQIRRVWRVYGPKIVVLKKKCVPAVLFPPLFNIFGRLAPSDVVTTPDNQLAWRNKHWINNDLTEKIITHTLFKFDLTFLAFFAGGQDGLFYCEYCCWVLFCKSKPRIPGFVSVTTAERKFGRF
jgi:hypothetical protein